MYDLISRKALRERLEPEYKDTVRLIQSGETHLDSLAEGYLEVHNLILSAPAVDAEPVRHGRWTEGKKNRFWGTKGNYICSNCQSTTGFVKFNYCPNCGAKMDG